MSRSEVKRLYEQTYTWKRKFLKKRQKYHKTFVHKIHGRKDFIFYCSRPKINQEFSLKEHGSKKTHKFVIAEDWFSERKCMYRHSMTYAVLAPRKVLNNSNFAQDGFEYTLYIVSIHKGAQLKTELQHTAP